MKGFTLFEILVVLGIFSFITMLTFPYTITSISKARTNGETQRLVAEIFQVQQSAYGGKNDSSHGISFASNSFTIFIGSSLATATVSEVMPLQSPVRITSSNFNGQQEVVFSKGSVLPVNAGSLVATDGVATYRIEISSEGKITYLAL